MPQVDAAHPGETRPFRVHACHLDSHHARLLQETSFEAAAVAYAEDLHAPASDDAGLSVIVRDEATGREHCFRIDLDSGEAQPCA